MINNIDTVGDLIYLYEKQDDIFETQLVPPFYNNNLNTEIRSKEWVQFIRDNATTVTDKMVNDYNDILLKKVPRVYADDYGTNIKDILWYQYQYRAQGRITQFYTYVNDKMERIFHTLTAEYNFLDNVDETRDEKTTRTPNLTTDTKIGSRTDSGSNTVGAQTITGSNSIGASTNSETVTDQTTTYSDSGTTNWLDKDKSSSTSNIGARTDSNSSNIGSRSDSTSSSIGEQNNQVKETGTEVTDYSVRRHGNIGVTSSMELLNQELSVADKDMFIQLFISEWLKYFTIGIFKEG